MSQPINQSGQKNTALHVKTYAVLSITTRTRCSEFHTLCIIFTSVSRQTKTINLLKSETEGHHHELIALEVLQKLMTFFSSPQEID